MSHQFVTVNWNRRKRIYDLCLWIGIILYLAAFILTTRLLFQGEEAISLPIVLMRALASCGFIMLTLILCIGPLARLDRRFLPLLYNRRHFGLSFFLVALLHALVAIFWYHMFGDINPLLSVVTSGGSYGNPADVPFQLYGLLALLLFFLLAATSHDYWNAVLGRAWKSVHMLVYPAYLLVIAHVGWGAMATDNTGLVLPVVAASVLLVGGLHLYTALFASRADIGRDIDPGGAGAGDGERKDWITVGSWRDIPDSRAVTVETGSGERVAVFRFDGDRLCAVSNVCQHQNGPLGEGRVVDGCITCPWHGYQYRPEDGCSPPPFSEKIETFNLALDGDTVLLDPQPLPRGTARPVLRIGEPAGADHGSQ